ncbi:MAG TPA: hypothetical protein PK514_09425 [Spirochaetota bacterium]|nr:hypothetical protein [Spirochaetota bacterium]
MKRRALPFADRIFFMVRNLIEYGRYKGDPVKAVKLLHKFAGE